MAITVGRDKPVAAAMALLGVSAEANRIAWHFRAPSCGVLPARASVSSARFRAGSTWRASAGVNGPQYIPGCTVL